MAFGRTNHRADFMHISGMVLARRAQFDREFENARSDAERHELVQRFPIDLAYLYGAMDRLLDDYLESR